jgi:hypothetical protein
MVFVEMSLKLLQRYLIAMAGARFSKESPSYLVGRDGSMPGESLIALALEKKDPACTSMFFLSFILEEACFLFQYEACSSIQ